MEEQKPKAKINLNRVAMPHQDPVARGKNYDEVALGYTEEMALEEAGRCIQCAKRPCVTGCPVDVDIPEFIEAMRNRDILFYGIVAISWPIGRSEQMFVNFSYQLD